MNRSQETTEKKKLRKYGEVRAESTPLKSECLDRFKSVPARHTSIASTRYPRRQYEFRQYEATTIPHLGSPILAWNALR